MLHTDEPLPCSDNPEPWFSLNRKTITDVKAACRACPRRLDCLEDVIATEELLGQQLRGVHGGLTPAERVGFKIRRIA